MLKQQIGPHYFLTGGTGILGTETLVRLVKRTPGARVTLLVRASDQASLQGRFEDLLDYVSFWNPDLDFSGVNAVRGDVTSRRLGLSKRKTRSLQQTVTHVIHSAASIRLGGDWEELHTINVGGTKKTAHFARGCKGLQRFVPISTAYVAGRREGEVLETDLDEGQVFVNNYERSKLEAELFVRSLFTEMPVTIVRPSIIVGDSGDGHIRSFQNIYTPLYFFGTGAVPKLPGDQDTLLDIVPVDYVAEVIVQTMHSEACIGGTYHACSGGDRLVPLEDLLHAARKTLGPSLWKPRPVAESALFKRLTCFFDYLAHSKTFARHDLERDLAERTPVQPNPEDFLPRLMRFWKGASFGKRMPWQVDRPGSQSHGGRVAGVVLSPEGGLE